MLVPGAIDTQGHSYVQLRALLENPGHIRKNSFLNLTIGHDVNRFELIVLVKGVRNFRKIFPRKRLATCKDQNAQVTAKGLGDSFNLVRLHLELLTRTVVKFVGKEAVRTTHVTN